MQPNWNPKTNLELAFSWSAFGAVEAASSEDKVKSAMASLESSVRIK